MKTITVDNHENGMAIHLTEILPEETGLAVGDDHPAQAKDNKDTITSSKSRTNRTHVDIQQLFDDWDGERYVAEEIDWGSPQGNEMW